jgi:SAM-dependent methyltransferase
MDLQKISAETVKRYSDRYTAMGKNIRTLGWGNEEQQVYRFLQSTSFNDLNGKTVLDIGCGFADYYNFLKGAGTQPAAYTGWDVNANFIDEAKAAHPGCDFNVVDLTNQEAISPYVSKYDAAVMFGLLNFNLKSEEVNLAYTKMMVTNAFTLVKDVLVVDFLSSNLYEGYPKEDFVFYHNPADMLNFALSLSPNVVLKHDYAPIPQKEFMLFIYK